MTEPDVVLSGLAKLPSVSPSVELSNRIRARGHARLLPARVHPAVSLMVAASVLAYLGWALLFTGSIDLAIGGP